MRAWAHVGEENLLILGPVSTYMLRQFVWKTVAAKNTVQPTWRFYTYTVQTTLLMPTPAVKVNSYTVVL